MRTRIGSLSLSFIFLYQFIHDASATNDWVTVNQWRRSTSRNFEFVIQRQSLPSPEHPGDIMSLLDGRFGVRHLGLLIHKRKDGTISTNWASPLSDNRTPHRVFIVNNGQSMVAIYHWDLSNPDKNLIGIYDNVGNLIGNYSATMLLPELNRQELDRHFPKFFWETYPRISSNNQQILLRIESNPREHFAISLRRWIRDLGLGNWYFLGPKRITVKRLSIDLNKGKVTTLSYAHPNPNRNETLWSLSAFIIMVTILYACLRHFRKKKSRNLQESRLLP